MHSAAKRQIREVSKSFAVNSEKLGLRFGDLGYNLLKLIEEYERAGLPFEQRGEGFRVWAERR